MINRDYAIQRTGRKKERTEPQENGKLLSISVYAWWENQKLRKKGAEIVFEEIMAEKFPNLLRNINLLLQEAHLTSNRIYGRDLQINESQKMLKDEDKEKNLENSKRKTTRHTQEHPNKINN